MSPSLPPDVHALLAAMSPWTDRVVFVGGTAHRLYRHHEWAEPVEYPPLATVDADIALPIDAFRGQELFDSLVTVGFVEELRGNLTPPVSHYHWQSVGKGLYVEFLSPLNGPEFGKDGASNATIVIGGVTSQRLRYVDLLLHAPWIVYFPFNANDGSQLRARVPHPVAYVAQKLLVLDRRSPADRAKDLLYVHDTVELFASRLTGIRNHWGEVLDLLPYKSQARLRASEVLTATRPSELHFSAARIAQRSGRHLTSTEIFYMLQEGFERLGMSTLPE